MVSLVYHHQQNPVDTMFLLTTSFSSIFVDVLTELESSFVLSPRQLPPLLHSIHAADEERDIPNRREVGELTLLIFWPL